MRINLPNQITIARLFGAVVFFICLAQFDASVPHPRWRLLDVSAGLFFIAAISDIIDGYLARKRNQVTSFGRVIDPFVDKVLVIGGYIFLAGNGFTDRSGFQISYVTPWMVVVILGRELLVTSLRGTTEASGQPFGANVYGKVKMALQSTTVVWLLITLAHREAMFTLLQVGRMLLYATVAVTALSALPYLWRARGVLAQTSVPA